MTQDKDELLKEAKKALKALRPVRRKLAAVKADGSADFERSEEPAPPNREAKVLPLKPK